MSAPTVAATLQIFRGELGVEEDPHGSNRVKYSSWYGLIGPWCAMFTSWGLQRAGFPRGPLTHFAYTPAGEAAYRAAGRWSTSPHVGALVFFNFIGRTSHVGIVEAVNASTITTIEGNTDVAGGRTGGRVMRQTRSGLIVGYGMPEYADAGTAPSDDEETPMYLCKLGDRGPEVNVAQRRLNRALEPAARLKVDGQYGDDTAAAVKAVASTSGRAIGPIELDRIETAVADRRARLAIAAALKDYRPPAAPAPKAHEHKATITLT